MDELLFPLAAVAATFLVLIPALTLVSRGVLAVSRRRTSSWPRFGSEATYAWLVAPTLLPILWLTSSAVHLSEPMRTAESCLISHSVATACLDSLVLLGVLVAGITALIGFRLWREWPRQSLVHLPNHHELVRRVTSIAQADPHLRKLRIVVACKSAHSVSAFGLLRPVVVLDACFVRQADREMLRAALLHEHAHIAGFDTLRGFVARLCLSANPVGWLLAPDLERWRNAREAVCDGEAVHRGGEPLALAEGLVRAARLRCGQLAPHSVALCGHSAATLKLRLALLLQGPPSPVRTLGHVALLVGVLAALSVPHVESLGLLDHFHFQVEHLFRSLL